MLVTDLDGTLLDPSGHIHLADAEAIALLRRRGVPVSICTGRMYSGTRPIAQRLKLDGPIACVDGSHIVHVLGKEDLFVASLEPDAGDLLRQRLDRADLATFAFASDTIVHDAKGQKYVGYLKTWSERMVTVGSVTSSAGWSTLQKISAVIALGEKDAIDEVVAGLVEPTGKPNESLQIATFPLRSPGRANGWAMLVRRANVDKGTATEWLARYHGVTLDQVVAVGDWVNDVPMFKVVGKSFVMSQAPDEVRQAASHVLTAHTQVGGGIREAAERAGLL